MTISAPEAIFPAYLLTLGVLPLLALAGEVRWSFGRFLAAFAFVTYGAMVAAITLFPIRILPAWRRPDTLLDRYLHLQPFTDIANPQFILNIVLFVPFGVLLPIVLPRLATLPRIALASLVTSLAIEGSQLAMLILLGNRRWVETDDLIANTAGAVIGYLIFAALAAAIGTGAATTGSPGRAAHDPVLR